jgi:pimeloyl-[acyl-carrier protein] methyl ester esterase
MNVVAVSGWGHAAEALRPVLDPLRSRWRVELHALPEFLATRPSLAKPSLLLGWSAGSLAVTEAVAQGRVQPVALVLLSATARFCACSDYSAGVPAANLRAMMIGIRRNPGRVLRQFFADCAHPGGIDEDHLVRKIDFATEALGAGTLSDGLAYLRDTDLRGVLAEVNVPTLLLHGRQDRIISVASAEFLQAGLPHAEMKILDEVGHALPEQAPTRVGRAIEEFLAELGK